MARIFTEDFEGGASGAAVTNANTGFGAVAAGAVFSTSRFAVGAKSATVTTGSTAANVLMNLNLGSTKTLMYSAFYLYFTAAPASALLVAGVTSGSTARATVRVNTDMTLSVRNGTTAVWTSTAAVPLNTWVRVEWGLNSTAAWQELQAFNLHSTTPLFDSGTQTFNTGSFNTYQTGLVAAAANASFGLDWVALDDAAWVGRGAVVNQPPTVTATRSPSGSVNAGTTVTLTGTATDSDGTIVSRQWTQTSGTAVTLTGATTSTATFTAPSVVGGTTLVFSFTATDNGGASATPATVSVPVNSSTASIAYRASAIGTNASAGAVTSATIPATAQAGDQLVAVYVDGGGNLTETLSGLGWAPKGTEVSTDNFGLRIWTKTAVAADAGATLSVTASVNGTSSYKRTLVILAYSGAAIGDVKTKPAATSSASHTAPVTRGPSTR